MGVIVPPCAVVTAPGDGRLARSADADAVVAAGDVIGEFVGRGGTTLLRAPVRGSVGGALAAPDQAVTAGEGVVWLRRR